MTINTKLKRLYKSLYPELEIQLTRYNRKNTGSERATNPLLLKVDKSYIEADVKIMFFGKETNVWLGERRNGAFLGEIEPVLDLYENFYLSGSCFSYGGQFWNGIKKFKDLLQEKNLDLNFGYVWNNVVKIGKCEVGNSPKINTIIKDNFSVIKREIEILEPDFLVFFSGPNYDNIINDIIGDFKRKKVRNFDTRELCELHHPDFPLAFRTYHPNYLWRNNIENYMNPIVRKIYRESEN